MSSDKELIKEITFKSGELVLRGKLHLPPVEKPPVIIGCHGLYSNSNSPKQVALAKKCVENGIAYFRFDHRGCGESEGVFEQETSLENRSEDLKSAIIAIQSMEQMGDIIGFFGSSFGGTVCINVMKTNDVPCIITFAAPVRSRSLVEHIEKQRTIQPDLPPFDRKKLQFDITPMLPFVHDILIFHGDSDKVVPPSHAWEIYNKSQRPKRLIMQRDGDHNMSRADNQDRFVRETILWIKSAIQGKAV